MGILRLFFLLAFGLIRFVAGQVGASSLTGMDETVAIQREGLQRLREFLGPSGFSSAPKKRAEEPTITFSNPAAQQFFVDGTSIPDGGSSYTEFSAANLLIRCTFLVNFDAGPSWAGLMPISSALNETRKLFFW